MQDKARFSHQLPRERNYQCCLTYVNSDYGKGLSDSFGSLPSVSGTVTISVPHETGKADYSAEVASMDSQVVMPWQYLVM